VTNADNGTAHPLSFASLADCLNWIEPRLLDAHQRHLGHEVEEAMPWWPAGYARDAEGRAFEIAVGAVLTQNTNWKNVEKALANLHAADDLLTDTHEPSAARLAGWHGLIVEHAKAHCRAKPACGGCPLRERCAHGKGMDPGG
jgi:endonuclease III-like uncharacterized protein